MSVLALLVGTSIFLMGQGLLGTLVGIRMADAGYSDSTSGIVMAGYFLGLMVGSLTATNVISISGHIRSFSVFATCFSAATLAHGFFMEAVFWTVLRFIGGYCIAGMFVCVESWLNERATNQTRGTILSIYSFTVYTAQGLAQFLLNIADVDGFVLFALASIMVSLALVPVAMTRVPAPPLPSGERFGFIRLYKISPLGVFACIMSGIIMGGFYGLGAVFAAKMGLGVGDVANFMAAVIIGGVILQWPIGRFSDRFDRRLVIAMVGFGITLAALAMVALSYNLVPISPENRVWVLIGMAALFGAFSYTLYPLAVAQTNDFIDSHELVPASGGLMLSYSIGAFAGPLLASFVMDFTGPGGLWGFISIASAATIVFALWRSSKGAAMLDNEDQGNYQMLARTTAIVAELDPRGEDDQFWLELDYVHLSPKDAGMENPHAGDHNPLSA